MNMSRLSKAESPTPTPTRSGTVGRALTSVRVVMRDIVLNSFVNGRAIPRKLRPILWSAFGHSIDLSATVNPDCFLGSSTGLSVGARTFINYGCFFDLNADTVIGEGCSIGYQVLFVTAGHEIGPEDRRAGDETARPIVVGDGSWIGARVTILPGVRIGEGCVIAAGSVVTSDCEAHYVYAGVPAVRKRALPRDGS